MLDNSNDLFSQSGRMTAARWRCFIAARRLGRKQDAMARWSGPNTTVFQRGAPGGQPGVFRASVTRRLGSMV
jgi:hypothetical protein